MYCTRTVPQMLPVQTAGDVQSVACVPTVQLMRHALPAALQLKLPGQAPLVDVWQVPAPLHRRGCTSVLPLQLGLTHTVPLAKSWQLPEPSQKPLRPQVDIAPLGHWLATAGGLPAGTSEQVPTLPVSTHDRQVPLQS